MCPLFVGCGFFVILLLFPHCDILYVSYGIFRFFVFSRGFGTT